MSSLASTVRCAWFRMPLVAIAVIAWLGGAAGMAFLYFWMYSTGSVQSDDGSTWGFTLVIFPVFVAINAVYAERSERREWGSIEERLDFGKTLRHPESLLHREKLPASWRKKLSAIVAGRAMGFMPFLIVSPLALIMILIPMHNGDAVWPSVVLVTLIFAVIGVGAILGARRARNAEIILGREHDHSASMT